MDSYWRSMLGKGHMVKILLILTVGAVFQVIQFGTNLEGQRKQQLRSEVHFGHEQKAQHSIAADDDRNSPDLDDENPLSEQNDLFIVSSDTLRAFASETNEDNTVTLGNEEGEGTILEFDIENQTDDTTDDTTDDLVTETEIGIANEQEVNDDDDVDENNHDDNDDENISLAIPPAEEKTPTSLVNKTEVDTEIDDTEGYYTQVGVSLSNKTEIDSENGTLQENLTKIDDLLSSLSNETESNTENGTLYDDLKVTDDLLSPLRPNVTNLTAEESIPMFSANETVISKNTSNSNSTAPSEANEIKVLYESSAETKQKALYAATKEKLDTTKSFNNASTFTTVTRNVYQEVVEKARVSIQSVKEDVYTGCEMYILPSAGEVENSFDSPRVQFKCLGDNNATLHDNICHTVNMCRVVLDEDAWKVAPSNSTSKTTTNMKKSTLLMMVDSVEYLMEPNNVKGFLNKASYAYRSDRRFYIWIGNLDQNELNRREVETLDPAFGYSCATHSVENSMHYYKPIAFLVLFEMLASSPHGSNSIFFLDADTSFNNVAFEQIADDKFHRTDADNENILEPIGPESYLDLSPQASLLGTTNLSGQMLMNTGLMIFRDTKWARDFLSLWWYGRCGGKDQLSLWLMLYATWSAWTEGQTPQFAYSGEIFFDYNYAKNKLWMHFRKYANSLQTSWEASVKSRQREQNEGGIENNDDDDDYMYPVENNDDDDYMNPVPTNIELYNGGSANLGRKLSAPIELPHVVILPPGHSVSYERNQVVLEDPTTLDVQEEEQVVHLLKLKGDDDSSFVMHSKNTDSCSGGRCWPYVQDFTS